VPEPDGRRLVLVHAHPDDESIETGATIAMYAAQGVQVTLVTCTLGELGEVIPPELAHLAADADGGLGEYRTGELAAACTALGVRDHRFLGGQGRWRDSGMMGAASNDWPGCFWLADVDEAAAQLLAVLQEIRPQVLVSYDANGFYGHPDHIQAHRVSSRAFDLADGLVSKFYATAMPRSLLPAAMALTPDGDRDQFARTGFRRVDSLADVPFGVDDDLVTTRIEAGDYLDAKLAAMRAHATQISVDGPFFALSDNVGRRVLGTEHYTLLACRGEAAAGEAAAGEAAAGEAAVGEAAAGEAAGGKAAAGEAGPDSLETDLFAGIR
jgi:N-acetyl-1-D-myo-inositol-2-amino-2-deoxy-alpha-D-glucopyranoside deacetylase